MDYKAKRRLTLSNTWVQAFSAFSATLLFALIIYLVQSMFDAQARSDQRNPLDAIHKIDPSFTLAVARTAQAVLSFLTTSALRNSFQFLQWAMAGRPHGLSYTSMLGLSPTTGGLGMLTLVSSFTTKASSKAWTITRGFFTMILWVSTLVLFYGTSQTTVYESAQSYNVTAGVGPFNGSLVRPFLDFLSSVKPGYPYTILPYNYYAMAGSLVTYPTFSTVQEPIYCTEDDCVSYLLSGGLEMAIPGVPNGCPQCPLVRIADVPAVQMEFNSLKDRHVFEKKDCSVFGDPSTPVGVELCLAQGPGMGGLRAALFSCANGTNGDECLGDRPLPNISYEVQLFNRQASIIASRSNHSIMGIEDITAPVSMPPIDIAAYRVSLGWLLNFTAANIPVPTSIAMNFAAADDQLLDLSADGVLSRNFQSILAFPLWFFNDNNWGNTARDLTAITPTLPSEFHTVAAVVTPYGKIEFSRTMFYLFIVLQGLSLLFIWAVLIWVWTISTPLPYISSFPLFDADFKLKTRKFAQDQSAVFNSEDTHALELVSRGRVYARGI